MRAIAMRYVKTITLYVICALVALVGLSLPSHADGELTVTVDDNNTAVRGEKFAVSIILTDNPGLSTISIKLSYDSSVMRLDSISFPSFLTDDENISRSVDGRTFTLTSSSSPMTRNGIYATAMFVLDNRAELGSYSVKASVGSGGVKGADGTDVDVKTKKGTVLLSCFHNYNKTVVKPTCSSEGYTEYRCTECSITYISDYVDKTEHSWRTVSSEDPTCTEAGSITRECKVCGERETKTSGEPSGHTYSDGVITASTCTTEGYTTYTCDKCGKTFRDSFTPVSNHRYHKTYTENATCAKTGFDLYSCEYCGTSYQITIPTLEHMWQVINYQPTHDSEGWSLYTCSSCGLSMRGNFTKKTDYQIVWSVTVEPTCTEYGIKSGVCSDGCGYRVSEDIEPTGHTYGEWTSVKKATLISGGIWQSICTKCGAVINADTERISEINAYEPNYYSVEFWKDVLLRIVESAAFSSFALLAVAAIFFLILAAMISKAKRRRRDRSVDDMLHFADEIDDAVKNQRPAPKTIPDLFCRDFDEFCLPAKPFDPSDVNDANDANHANDSSEK